MAQANDKLGLVSRLLGTDSTLGIIAGLTTLAAESQSNNDDDGDDDDEVAELRRAGTPSASNADKRGGGGKAKPGSHGGAGVASPTDGAPSPALSASAKKYSVHEQRDVIRKLQERNQILKQELSIEFRDAKQLLAQEKRQRVEYLQKMTETFAKKVENARKTVAKLDEQIAKKEHELETLRQQQYHGGGGSDASSGGASNSTGQSSTESNSGVAVAAVGETGAAITRRVRSLENRLELTLVKRNEMDSINKHLRWQIEKVRKDRVIFDGIYKKLEKELSDFQSRHDASVEELRRATETKDQINREIQQIEAEAEAEQREYDLEFKELRHAIESAMRDVQDANARLGGTGAVGVFGDREQAASPMGKSAGGHSRGAAFTAVPSVTAASPSADSPLKRITALSSWKIGFDKALASTSDSIVSKYDQVFDGIKKMTGITDITKIAEAITHKDEENFKRFKHVEGLHREEAALKAQAEQLTQAIEEFKAKEGIATGTTQKQQFRTLETKYHQVLDKNRAFDLEHEEATNKLTRIKSSVHSIHSMLVHANCARNADPFSLHGGSNLALGSHSARDITDTNVLEYLQAIEIFTSSLMKENHESSAAAGSDQAGPFALSSGTHAVASSSSPIGQGPSTLPSDPAQKLRVQVPSFGGLNGVIILPASSSPIPKVNIGSRTLSSSAQQQQQRKKTGRLDLSSRKSLSQQQFAAALAGPATPTAVSTSSAAPVDDARSVGTPPNGPPPAPNGTATFGGPTKSSVEDDDDEHAYTYEELRDFAAKHIVKRRDDPLAHAIANSLHGPTASVHHQ